LKIKFTVLAIILKQKWFANNRRFQFLTAQFYFIDKGINPLVAFIRKSILFEYKGTVMCCNTRQLSNSLQQFYLLCTVKHPSRQGQNGNYTFRP
jgi:hypothetical protein